MAGTAGTITMAPGAHALDRVSRLRLTAAELAAVPRALLEPVRDEHVRYLARDLVAGEIDRWLRELGHQEARCRAVFGRLAAVFLRQRAAQRLGFRRMDDYARERLGISARELQSAARVVTVLGGLPRLAAAFEAGVLSWTQVRILVTVATPATELHWLELARGRTVRALEALVRRRRAGGETTVPGDSEEAPVQTDGWEDSADLNASQGLRDPERDAADLEDLEHLMVRFHLRCPRRVRWLWRRAVELARRMLGRDGPLWQAAEAVAAEGLAAAPAGFGNGAGGGGDASPSSGEARHGRYGDGQDRKGGKDGKDGKDGADERPPAWQCLDWSAVRAAIPREITRLAEGCERLDAFALDARLRQVLQAQRRIDWQLGRLLDTCVRLRLERLLGFPSLVTYARERLGLSPSKVRGLLAIERLAQAVPGFGAAYEAGALSWVRALALLPVLAGGTAAAWTARAQAVTVRRLVAEVDWSLGQQDANPALAVPPEPPPAGLDLAADAAAVERQMRAPRHGGPEWSRADAEITFAGPVSVVGLVQAAVAGFRRPGEPRWLGFERLLEHVVGEWEALPRHADPIFARDGWRCAVPACEARGNLHDHHLQFRSLGGSNAQANRVTVCAWHHLRGIHAGLVRASGTAPGAVRWELGLRAGQPSLLSFIGEAYVRGRSDGSSTSMAQHAQPSVA